LLLERMHDRYNAIAADAPTWFQSLDKFSSLTKAALMNK